MTTKLFDLRKSRRGVSAVEFSVVVPVLLVLVFGLIEAGRMISVQQAVTNAAREGCRKAVLATTTSKTDVDTAVRRYLRSVIRDELDTEMVRVTVEPQSFTELSSGTEVTVHVEVNYSDVSWLPCHGFDPVIGSGASQQRE